MLDAIAQGRRGYTMAVNATNTAFHRAYWEYLQKHHPHVQMARPKNRGNNSNWIIFSGTRLPQRREHAPQVGATSDGNRFFGT